MIMTSSMITLRSTRIFLKRSLIACFGLTMVMMTMGCLNLTPGEKSVDISTRKQKVQAASSVTTLPQSPSISADEFERKLTSLTAAKRHVSARHLCMLYPEYANPASTQKAGEISRVSHTVVEAHHYRDAEKLLTESEQTRKNGNHKASQERWTEAIKTANHALQSRPSVIDPAFWEKASALKLADAAWPEMAVQHWRTLAAEVVNVDGYTLSPEALLWLMIGQARYERGEFQSALIAFKRSESYVASPVGQSWLAILEAKALLQLGQQQAAMTILVPLTNQPKSALGAAATAVVASVRLSEAGIDQALKLFEASLVANPSLEWPQRDEAEADLALVYLTKGDEKLGMRWLTSARERFTTRNKWNHLLQSWENEARYYESLSKPDEARKARQRMHELESR